MSEELRIEKLYNLSETIAAELFEGLDYPWQALPVFGLFMKKLGSTLVISDMMRQRKMSGLPRALW